MEKKEYDAPEIEVVELELVYTNRPSHSYTQGPPDHSGGPGSFQETPGQGNGRKKKKKNG